MMEDYIGSQSPFIPIPRAVVVENGVFAHCQSSSLGFTIYLVIYVLASLSPTEVVK